MKSSVKISSKLPNFGTTIFTVMSKMAHDFGAINLSQGFPDFNSPDELLDLVNHYIRAGFNQYSPMPGVQVLRENIAAKILKLYGRQYDYENEITVTAGATQAIFTAIASAIGKDDEVIILEPAFDTYTPSVSVAGGRPVPVPLNSEDYSIDWQRVKNAVTDKTKMIIINSPHNPTGSIITENDIQALEEITRGTDIIILSDEVYEHILFDGRKHISISQSPELAERSFIVSSFGKTYHATGWKIGYCTAPETLMREFRKVHQFNVFAVNTPIQYAYADFMKNEEHYLTLGEFYGQKRDFVLEHLENSRFKFVPTGGTYFQLLDYSEISDLNDLEFTERLTKEFKVATIPLTPFYSDKNPRKVIRICFAKKEEVLRQAAEKLSSLTSL